MFLINVPDVAAANSSRGFIVSIVVYSANLIGLDRFLGRVDIPLTVLKSEEKLEGWFALRPKVSSIKYSTNTLRVSGSVRLHIQWIYSLDGLVRSLVETTQNRMTELTALLSTTRDLKRGFDHDEATSKRSRARGSNAYENLLSGALKEYASETTGFLRRQVQCFFAPLLAAFKFGSFFDRWTTGPQKGLQIQEETEVILCSRSVSPPPHYALHVSFPFDALL